MYLKSIRKNSPYLLDDNGISVVSPFGDISSTYLIKEAGVAAFRAFTASDEENQKTFVNRLVDAMVDYAVHEYDWKPENAEKRIKQVIVNRA
jgi:hypothetical protein